MCELLSNANCRRFGLMHLFVCVFALSAASNTWDRMRNARVVFGIVSVSL